MPEGHFVNSEQHQIFNIWTPNRRGSVCHFSKGHNINLSNIKKLQNQWVLAIVISECWESGKRTPPLHPEADGFNVSFVLLTSLQYLEMYTHYLCYNW